jgi:DNA replication protein DnaD
MKTYTSVIKIEWAGNKEYAESKQHYIDKVIKQFYDDFGIELSPSEISEIKEVL